MSAASNRDLVRRSLEDVFNEGDLAAIDQIFSLDFVYYSSGAPGGIVGNRDSLRHFAAEVRSLYPDLQMKVEELFCSGSRVALRFSAHGTHLGEGMGMRPTGKHVSWEGITIAHIAEGKIAEQWTHVDNLAILQQLGVIPQPERIRI